MKNITPTRKSDLSPARRRLLELMQQLGFGRIEALHVCGGEPVLSDPAPRLYRELRFAAGENGPRPELRTHDFVLKAQVVELFQGFDQIGDGIIDVISVKHGLPFSLHHQLRC